MKKYRSYIIYGILILVLISAIILVSNIDTKVEVPPDTDENVIEEIYSVNSDDILSVSIKNSLDEYTVLYGEDIKIENKNVEKDDEKLSELKREFSSLFASDVIADSNLNLEDFGLLNPVNSIDISLKSGDGIKLFLGNKTPDSAGYYLKYKDDKKVYIIDNYKADCFLRKLDYYRNTVLFSVPPSTVNKVVFSKGKNICEFLRNDHENLEINSFAAFNMVRPYNWEVEASILEKCLDHLNEVEILEYVEDNLLDVSKYGIKKSDNFISVTDLNGVTKTIYLGSNKDGNLYIMNNESNSVYLVSAEGFEFLDYEPIVYLQQFVALRSIDDLKKFSYSFNNSVSQFEIKVIDSDNHDIKHNNKLIDQKIFKEIYREIISIKMAGAVDYKAQGEPVAQYTFIYNNDKSETVKYYKVDERKIAASVNGKIYFYVDATEFYQRINKVNEIINKNLNK